jgi:hypothetical protein
MDDLPKWVVDQVTLADQEQITSNHCALFGACVPKPLTSSSNAGRTRDFA